MSADACNWLMTNSTVAGSVYPAYASYKAINSRNNARLTAWLMYWTVMGLFTLVEFVLDTFIFWFPFYYEIKLIFVLWMILPQSQGSIYLYQTVVDPYLSKHEHDIDKALKDMQKQTLTMGIQYMKLAMQIVQKLVLDLINKLQSQGDASLLVDKDDVTTASSHSASPQDSPTREVATDSIPNAQTSVQGYFSWAYHALSPKLAAVATMASQSVSRSHVSHPLPELPMDLYTNKNPSTDSTTSGDSSASRYGGINIFGINSSAAVSTTSTTEPDRSSSRSDRAADHSSSLRNRMISLYDDYEIIEPQPYSVNHSAHASENSWSSGKQ
ncbi:hypothetical protein BGZ65_002240 [Modicella reniformis]|uniref:Protein YOP1 n=1 Tax=Modicella reniformis TaxID=1440133 RepID=A0A9P6J1H1_9FUNG|nr:hypothetical protein BGZ65_002240 [Modicella reniformis]